MENEERTIRGIVKGYKVEIAQYNEQPIFAYCQEEFVVVEEAIKTFLEKKGQAYINHKFPIAELSLSKLKTIIELIKQAEEERKIGNILESSDILKKLG